MAGRKAIKSINWIALFERVPEAEKNNFSAFKATSDSYARRLEELPPELPKINWSDYKNKISDPTLIDKFQKGYEGIKVSYPEDKYTNKISEVEKQVNEQLKQFIVESNKRIEGFNASMKKWTSIMKYRDMTMEDFKDAHPDIAFDVNRPTLYPHTPDFQPDTAETETPKK